MIGEALGYDYGVPGTREWGSGGFIQQSEAEKAAAAQGQFQPAQGQAMLPDIGKEIAQIEGMTDQYYDTYGKLKSYVEQMNALGIDVTKPDITKPGGGDEFKVFKMLEAGLLSTSNKLAQEKELRKQRQPLFDKGMIRTAPDFDERTQLMLENPNAVYTTELDPGVKDAMDILKENPETAADVANQEKYYKSIIGELTTLRDNAPNEAEKARMQYQIDQLHRSYRKDKIFAPKSPGRTTATDVKLQGALAAAERFVSHKYGATGFTDTSIDKDGNVTLINNAYNDWAFTPGAATERKTSRRVSQPRTIQDFVRKGDKTYVRFKPIPIIKNGQEVDQYIFKDVELTDENTETTFTTLINENKDRIGFTQADADAALKEAGYIKEKGFWDKDKMLKGRQLTKVDTKEYQKVVNNALDQIKALKVGKSITLNGKLNTIQIDFVDDISNAITPWGKEPGYIITVNGTKRGSLAEFTDLKQMLIEEGYLQELIDNKSIPDPEQVEQSSDEELDW
jgi:hypothetical protein